MDLTWRNKFLIRTWTIIFTYLDLWCIVKSRVCKTFHEKLRIDDFLTIQTASVCDRFDFSTISPFNQLHPRLFQFLFVQWIFTFIYFFLHHTHSWIHVRTRARSPERTKTDRTVIYLMFTGESIAQSFWEYFFSAEIPTSWNSSEMKNESYTPTLNSIKFQFSYVKISISNEIQTHFEGHCQIIKSTKKCETCNSSAKRAFLLYKKWIFCKIYFSILKMPKTCLALEWKFFFGVRSLYFIILRVARDIYKQRLDDEKIIFFFLSHFFTVGGRRWTSNDDFMILYSFLWPPKNSHH